MARTSPESRLQKRIQNAVRDEWDDAFMFKVHGGPYQQAGIPDLVGSVEGRFVALEVKHPDQGHEESAIQRIVRVRLEKAGAIVAVVESVDEALDFIRRSLASEA